MTHDQKPGRVRVLGPADTTPQRRREDVPPVVVDAPGGPGAGKVAGAGRPAKTRIALALLFLMGAAIGGTAMAMAGLA